ncbi:MAG: DNA-methyltransferase [Planctomyces sp.]
MGTKSKVITNPMTAAVPLDDSWVDRIHQGDCIETMRQLPAGRVHLVFADPPFNIGYDYDEYDDRLEESRYLEWSSRWMAEVHRVLVSTGTFWLAIGDEYAAELKVEAKKLGFVCRSWVIWYYTFGVNCKYKFTRSHAHLFHFVKDPCAFTFNHDQIRVPSARQLVYGDQRANSGGRLPDDTWILRPQDCPESFTAEEDTWYFARVAGTFSERAGFHGCQMPEQLLARIIRTSSREGDLVLDPFAGSASTLITARKLGRRVLGCELSQQYTEEGSKRLAAVNPGDALVGPANPLTSAPKTADGRRLPDQQPGQPEKTRRKRLVKKKPSTLFDE